MAKTVTELPSHLVELGFSDFRAGFDKEIMAVSWKDEIIEITGLTGNLQKDVVTANESLMAKTNLHEEARVAYKICMRLWSAILTMLIPPMSWIYVEHAEFVPADTTCVNCRRIGKKFWYTVATVDTNDVTLRFCQTVRLMHLKQFMRIHQK